MAVEAETLEHEPGRRSGPVMALALVVILLLVLTRLVTAGADGGVGHPAQGAPKPPLAPVRAHTTAQVVTIAPQCRAEAPGPVRESCRRAIEQLLASLAVKSPPQRSCAVGADAAEHWVRATGHLPGCSSARG